MHGFEKTLVEIRQDASQKTTTRVHEEIEDAREEKAEKISRLRDLRLAKKAAETKN